MDTLNETNRRAAVARGSIALALALALAGCARAPAVIPGATLPLRRVVIYRNGVGYFERRGHVREDHVEFHVRRGEVGDFLATLAVMEQGGSSVVSAAFPMPDRAASRDGAASSGGAQDARSTVRLQLDGRHHDLSVGYMTETPIWRPSYRLVYAQDGSVNLQAWGIVQNLSGEDWTGVRLALVAGAPVAFRSELAEPVTALRPLVTDRGEVVESVPRGETALRQVAAGDQDGDGVADADDLCPADPEDRDAFEDTDGCADADNDHDRIADANDRCPSSPETYNGIDDEDGCPDQGRVVVEEGQIRILQMVNFPQDAERPPAASNPVLDAVARTLVGNPQITRVAVDGHADPSEGRGSAAAREALSRARAANVLAYLVAHGVDGGRLELRAFGDARPLAANLGGGGPNARARNRRVTFTILATVDGPTGADDAREGDRGADANRGGQGGRAGANGQGQAAQQGVVPSSPRNAARVAALATQQGGTGRFELAAPVTIPNQSAAMVLLVARSVPGARTYLFAPDPGVAASATHPFEVARFANRTGALLERGPLAIYDSSSFLGQGVLEPLPAGAMATVPFAIERAIVVESSAANAIEGARLVRLARGEVTVERYHVTRTTYRLRSGIDRPVRVMLRHAVAAGSRLHEPPDGTEESDAAALVPAQVAANARAELVVQTRAPFETRVSWTDEQALEALEGYLRDGSPDAQVAAALRTALDLRARIVARARERAAADERRVDLARAADETRANLAAIERTPRAGDLRAQLTARLAQTSAQVEQTDRRIVELDTEIGEARVRLAEAVRGVEVDVTAAAARR